MIIIVRLVFLAVFTLVFILAEAGLIDNSPFIPPGFQPDATQSAGETAATGGALSAQVNFRGYYKLDDTYYFLLSKKGSPDGAWVRLGDRGDLNNEFQIHQFDEKGEKVEISYNMARGWLDLLKEVTFLPGNVTPGTGSTPSRAGPVQTRILPQGGTRSVVQNRPLGGSISGRAGLTSSISSRATSGRGSFNPIRPIGRSDGEPSVTEILGGRSIPSTPGRRSNEIDLLDLPTPQSQGALIIPDLPDKPPTEAPSEAPQILPSGG